MTLVYAASRQAPKDFSITACTRLDSVLVVLPHDNTSTDVHFLLYSTVYILGSTDR